jgi:hypothetical protein
MDHSASSAEQSLSGISYFCSFLLRILAGSLYKADVDNPRLHVLHVNISKSAKDLALLAEMR